VPFSSPALRVPRSFADGDRKRPALESSLIHEPAAIELGLANSIVSVKLFEVMGFNPPYAVRFCFAFGVNTAFSFSTSWNWVMRTS
jgi:hypothetical protein